MKNLKKFYFLDNWVEVFIRHGDGEFVLTNKVAKNNHHKTLKKAKELQLENRKEEYIMIEDSLTSDIFFANPLGIKSIWYNRKKLLNTTSYIPTLEVSSLLELKSIF